MPFSNKRNITSGATVHVCALLCTPLNVISFVNRWYMFVMKTTEIVGAKNEVVVGGRHPTLMSHTSGIINKMKV